MSDGTELDLDAVGNDPKGMRKVLEEIGPELKSTKDALAQAQAEIAGFQREKAFHAAGVPEGDDGTVFDLFRKSYQGELSPDSIIEAFKKLGVPEPQTPQAEPQAQQTQAEPQAQAEVDPATAAAIADAQQIRTQFSPGLTDEANDAFKAMNEATTLQDIERIARQIGVPMSS